MGGAAIGMTAVQWAATVCQVLSAGFAFLAAALWWRSAIIETPEKFSVHVVKPRERPLGGDPFGGTYVGQAYSNDFQELGTKLRQQSKLSARAATHAGISAAFAAVAAILQVILMRSGAPSP